MLTTLALIRWTTWFCVVVMIAGTLKIAHIYYESDKRMEQIYYESNKRMEQIYYESNKRMEAQFNKFHEDIEQILKEE